jgi:protocatechuate 3,4-dioxygenase beta subunit
MPAPTPFHIRLDRRRLLGSLLLASGGAITGDLYAEALALTAPTTEGPYYPDHLPLDQDNDLTRILESDTIAAGTATEIGGRVLAPDGSPLEGRVVVLWQADANGCYLHSRGAPAGKERDPHFQGYGRATTNAKGEYRFRTIKPGLYGNRTLHWHVAVNEGKERLLTTQLFVAGQPENDRDGVLRRVGSPEQQLTLMREFAPPSPDSDELVASWDIVIGRTAPDPTAA